MPTYNRQLSFNPLLNAPGGTIPTPPSHPNAPSSQAMHTYGSSNANQTMKWLQKINMEKYAPQLNEHQMTANVLRDIDSEFLSEIGVDLVDHGVFLQALGKPVPVSKTEGAHVPFNTETDHAVHAWLDLCGLGQYAPNFHAQKVTPDVINNLDRAFLQHLGVLHVGHQIIMLRSVEIRRRGQYLPDEMADFEELKDSKNSTGVQKWLSSLRVEDFLESFRGHQINNAMMQSLDRDYLQQIGVSLVSHQIRMLRSLQHHDDSEPRVGDVKAWLEDLGMTQYLPYFIRHEVTMAVFPDLDRFYLREMGVSLVAHQICMLRAL
jgi:hypothetical protein